MRYACQAPRQAARQQQLPQGLQHCDARQRGGSHFSAMDRRLSGYGSAAQCASWHPLPPRVNACRKGSHPGQLRCQGSSRCVQGSGRWLQKALWLSHPLLPTKRGLSTRGWHSLFLTGTACSETYP